MQIRVLTTGTAVLALAVYNPVTFARTVLCCTEILYSDTTHLQEKKLTRNDSL